MKASIQFSDPGGHSVIRGARYTVAQGKDSDGQWLFRVVRTAIEFYVDTHPNLSVEEMNLEIGNAARLLSKLYVNNKVDKDYSVLS